MWGCGLPGGGGELGGVSCEGEGGNGHISDDYVPGSIPSALCSGVEYGQCLHHVPLPDSPSSGSGPDSTPPPQPTAEDTLPDRPHLM